MTPEQRQWCYSGSSLLSLNVFHTLFHCSTANFEHVFADWAVYFQFLDVLNSPVLRQKFNLLVVT